MKITKKMIQDLITKELNTVLLEKKVSTYTEILDELEKELADLKKQAKQASADEAKKLQKKVAAKQAEIDKLKDSIPSGGDGPLKEQDQGGMRAALAGALQGDRSQRQRQFRQRASSAPAAPPAPANPNVKKASDLKSDPLGSGVEDVEWVIQNSLAPRIEELHSRLKNVEEALRELLKEPESPNSDRDGYIPLTQTQQGQ